MRTLIDNIYYLLIYLLRYLLACLRCDCCSQRRVVSRDQAVEELRRGDGPTAVIIDMPSLEFDVVNLLLANDLLQASCQCRQTSISK